MHDLLADENLKCVSRSSTEGTSDNLSCTVKVSIVVPVHNMCAKPDPAKLP